jgi:hypothetical protein
MPTEERMTLNERWKYLRLVRERRVEASKLERGRLLDEMEAVTRLHRQSLIRLMSGSLERKSRQMPLRRRNPPADLVFFPLSGVRLIV